jgi:segregation and condensation protein A
MSADFKYRLATAGRMHPRTVGLDPRFQGLLPEVVFGFGPDDFANLAARALEPKLPEVISVAHIHAARVSVREQAAIIVERLRRMGTATFKTLTRDCDTTLLVVARFLALLEIYRDGVVLFDQPTPLGDLHIRWVGDDNVDINREIDEFDASVVDEDFALAPPTDVEGNVFVQDMHDNLDDPDEDDDDNFDVHSDHQETPSNEGENVTDE